MARVDDSYNLLTSGILTSVTIASQTVGNFYEVIGRIRHSEIKLTLSENEVKAAMQ